MRAKQKTTCKKQCERSRVAFRKFSTCVQPRECPKHPDHRHFELGSQERKCSRTLVASTSQSADCAFVVVPLSSAQNFLVILLHFLYIFGLLRALFASISLSLCLSQEGVLCEIGRGPQFIHKPASQWPDEMGMRWACKSSHPSWKGSGLGHQVPVHKCAWLYTSFLTISHQLYETSGSVVGWFVDEHQCFG